MTIIWNTAKETRAERVPLLMQLQEGGRRTRSCWQHVTLNSGSEHLQDMRFLGFLGLSKVSWCWSLEKLCRMCLLCSLWPAFRRRLWRDGLLLLSRSMFGCRMNLLQTVWTCVGETWRSSDVTAAGLSRSPQQRFRATWLRPVGRLNFGSAARWSATPRNSAHVRVPAVTDNRNVDEVWGCVASCCVAAGLSVFVCPLPVRFVLGH